MQRFDYDRMYGDVIDMGSNPVNNTQRECKNGVCPVKRNTRPDTYQHPQQPQHQQPQHQQPQLQLQQHHPNQQQHHPNQQHQPHQLQHHQQPQQYTYYQEPQHDQQRNYHRQQQQNTLQQLQKQAYQNTNTHSDNAQMTHPYFKESGSAGGHVTRSKKSELYQFQRQLEPNHIHPNHIKKTDPFHGTIDHNANQKIIRNQNMHKYQMDPRRTMSEMNKNAQNMFNSHNEQIKLNEFSKFASTHNLEPSYYDQSNYSGIDLEADRMFLADAKEVSDQYANAASVSGKNIQFINNSSMNMTPEQSEESLQFKQRRSYRNPNDEVDSNNKIWEYQFTPMTIPL